MWYEDIPNMATPEGRGTYLARCAKHDPAVVPAVLAVLLRPPTVEAKHPGTADAALAAQVLVDHLHHQEVRGYVREMLRESAAST